MQPSPTAASPGAVLTSPGGSVQALTYPTRPLAHLGNTPLALFFEPAAIREHFDGVMDLTGFTDLQLASAGAAALCDDGLYDAFSEALTWAMTTVTPGPDAIANGVTVVDVNAKDDEDDEDGVPTQRSYECAYSITSLMDNHAEAVAEGEVTVCALHKANAIGKAIEWVQENDSHFDDRIDPRVTITDITRKD